MQNLSTMTQIRQSIAAIAAERANKAPPPPLPADPDEAAALALAFIVEGRDTALPGEVFAELTRRNHEIAHAPREEIQKTLARQIVLLEATALRLLQKAALAPTTSAAAEFTRSALATERVLIQALGAVHSLNQNQRQVQVLPQEEAGDADES